MSRKFPVFVFLATASLLWGTAVEAQETTTYSSFIVVDLGVQFAQVKTNVDLVVGLSGIERLAASDPDADFALAIDFTDSEYTGYLTLGGQSRVYDVILQGPNDRNVIRRH